MNHDLTRCYRILDATAANIGRSWTSKAFHSLYAYRLVDGTGIDRQTAERIVARWLRATFNGPNRASKGGSLHRFHVFIRYA
jgi:hypothetical protein